MEPQCCHVWGAAKSSTLFGGVSVSGPGPLPLLFSRTPPRCFGSSGVPWGRTVSTSIPVHHCPNLSGRLHFKMTAIGDRLGWRVGSPVVSTESKTIVALEMGHHCYHLCHCEIKRHGRLKDKDLSLERHRK